MSDDAHPTRFKKGQSGNPKGRPRRTRKPSSASSPLQVILDRSLTVDGPDGPRALTVEEALLQKTLEDALGGQRRARRKIFKMVLEREKARAKAAEKRGVKRSTEYKRPTIEHDPRNADEVLKLLGIAIEDARWANVEERYGGPLEDERLLIDTWAAQAALSRRRGGEPLSDRDIEEIERCTYRPEDLKWPRSMRDG
jgi:hypothetical protein